MHIYERLTKGGTLSAPKEELNPLFSLPSTVNWMRGLAFIVADKPIDHTFSKSFYSEVNLREANEHEINTILEQLLFALHQCSALRALKSVPRKADVARVGIVSWYYGVYAAASAMITAQDGSFQEDHATTARVWDDQVSKCKLIAPPFDLRITTLVKKASDIEVENLGKKQNYLIKPTLESVDEAYGACYEYLSGTVKWSRAKVEENLKSYKEFKELGVENFRKKKAREFRDRHLSKKTVCFLHQAFRYRGKANYRDAIFLGFGKETKKKLNAYIDDLSSVLDAFVCQAGIFCSCRLGEDIWKEFLDDLESGRSFSLSPSAIWGGHE